MNIARVDVRRLEIPLTTPYRLAFGPVTRYDTIIVETTFDDGRSGFGEATLLTGYTDETIDDGWALAREIAATLPGSSDAVLRERTHTLARHAPFVATAFRTALDMAGGHPLLQPARAMRVPMLGLLQGADRPSLRDAFERLLEAGYRTVKVKIGFDVDEDLRYVTSVQAIVGGRAAIRVDANQGYTAAQAAAFIRSVDVAGIELFEQPCAAGDWSAHREAAVAASARGLPLMLDESIYAVDDIERAARESACAYVKVKLMKFAGIDALVAAIERIRSLGMRPVLGNGVACDVSCWMEACVAARHIDNAGEMNGFLKAPRMLFAKPLACERGEIVIDPGTPSLDPEALDAFTRERVAFDLERARAPG